MTLSVTAIPPWRDRDARAFYAACCRMVFGLSSSKPPRRLTSDHLPSARNLAQNQKSGSQETRHRSADYADFRNPWTVDATAFVLLASGRAIVRSRRGRGRARVSCNCIRTPGHAVPASRERAWASLRQTDLRRACSRPAVFRSVSDAEKNIRDRR